MPRLTLPAETKNAEIWRPVLDWLGQGRAVVFPTDTFYGLAVDPTNPTALENLFRLKGRSATSALPFVAASRAQVEAACGPLSALSSRLASRFWPGPLSLVLNPPPAIDRRALGDAASIAIRVPDHPLARALAKAWGSPLPATSANRSGAAPVQSPELLDATAADPIVLVLDGGLTPGGAPSTIVDARQPTPRLVREGAIAWSRVLDFLEG